MLGVDVRMIKYDINHQNMSYNLSNLSLNLQKFCFSSQPTIWLVAEIKVTLIVDDFTTNVG